MLATCSITELENANIQVAYPEHDRGIDLIAFRADRPFQACALQVKAFAADGFYTNDKYLRIASLRIVYI